MTTSLEVLAAMDAHRERISGEVNQKRIYIAQLRLSCRGCHTHNPQVCPKCDVGEEIDACRKDIIRLLKSI